MEVISGNGTILGITVPNRLSEYNSDNDTMRARLSFRMVGSSNEELSETDKLLSVLSQSAEYSVIIDLSSIEGKTFDDKVLQANKLLGDKTATFTVYRWTVEDLTGGKYARIYTDAGRTYSALTDPYIGSVDREKESFSRIVSRLKRDIDNGVLSFTPFEEEEQQQQTPPVRGNQRRNPF